MRKKILFVFFVLLIIAAIGTHNYYYNKNCVWATNDQTACCDTTKFAIAYRDGHLKDGVWIPGSLYKKYWVKGRFEMCE